MVKTVQILDFSEEKYHYITAITKPEIETLLKKNITQSGLFDEGLCEIEDGDILYIYRRNPIRAMEIEGNRNEKLETLQTLCAQKCKYLRHHPRAKVGVAERIAKEKAKRLRIDK